MERLVEWEEYQFFGLKCLGQEPLRCDRDGLRKKRSSGCVNEGVQISRTLDAHYMSTCSQTSTDPDNHVRSHRLSFIVPTMEDGTKKQHDMGSRLACAVNPAFADVRATWVGP